MKHKMEEKRYAVILSGPAASGKTSVAHELWQVLPNGPANISLDDVKHMIFSARSTDHYLDLASRNGIALMKNFLDAGHGVIISKAFCKYLYARPFIEEASRRGVPVYYFKLKASLEELLRRNEYRQHRLPKWKVEDIYRLDQRHSHPEGIEIDTEAVTVEEIVRFISATVLSVQEQ